MEMLLARRILSSEMLSIFAVGELPGFSREARAGPTAIVGVRRFFVQILGDAPDDPPFPDFSGKSTGFNPERPRFAGHPPSRRCRIAGA